MALGTTIPNLPVLALLGGFSSRFGGHGHGSLGVLLIVVLVLLVSGRI